MLCDSASESLCHISLPETPLFSIFVFRMSDLRRDIVGDVGVVALLGDPVLTPDLLVVYSFFHLTGRCMFFEGCILPASLS